MKCALTLLKPECTRRWPNFRFRSRLQERPHPLSLCFPAMVVELMNNLVSYKTSVKNKVLKRNNANIYTQDCSLQSCKKVLLMLLIFVRKDILFARLLFLSLFWFVFQRYFI